MILPHHGSIAKEVRLETEQKLKRGEVDAVLATSSLELGIDIGTLDLVVQIDSPGSVAAGLQRVGRAGHLEKATAKGRFVARGLYELPSFGALLPLMGEGVVEETHVPVNCLDVLAQQVVAACVVRPWKRSELFRMFRRAMPYEELLEKQFDSVVGMLSKRAERVTALGAGGALRPRLSFDRVNDELTALPGTAGVVMLNSGVIADTGMFAVYLAGTEEKKKDEGRKTKLDVGKEGGFGVRLGELDEEFVFETKEGDRIVLGSQTWRVLRIDADRVIVERATPGSSRMPFWRGEKAPRTEMLGEAVARFHGEMARRVGGSRDVAGVREWLMREHLFDDRAAENAISYYRRQMERSAVPDEGQLVVEHFVDRTGEPLIAILSPLGSRVNYALRLALEVQFARRRLPAQVVHHDDGILIRPPTEVAGGGEVPENPLVWLKSGAVEAEIADQLESTALFGMRFRQNAARALMLPKMTLSQRTPLWQQRLRARHLLALVKQQRNFPIMVETYRECMQDVLGIGQVEALLGKIERGEVGVKVVRQRELGVCSPFARSLFSQFTAAYLYEWDDPLVAGEIEPAVDQRVLDEILRRRGEGGEVVRDGEAVKKSWSAEDEWALARRISGVDYPARTAEELLEKIEAAGAAGVGFGDESDARWGELVVGGAEEAKRMLLELRGKRRVVRVLMRGRKKAEQVWRWVGIDSLGLLIAARDGECGQRLEGGGLRAELPGAILQTELPAEEARQVLVEQVLRREAVTTRAAVIGELSWMKEAPALLDEMRRAGQVMEVLGDGDEAQLLWGEYAGAVAGDGVAAGAARGGDGGSGGAAEAFDWVAAGVGGGGRGGWGCPAG